MPFMFSSRISWSKMVVIFFLEVFDLDKNRVLKSQDTLDLAAQDQKHLIFSIKIKSYDLLLLRIFYGDQGFGKSAEFYRDLANFRDVLPLTGGLLKEVKVVSVLHYQISLHYLPIWPVFNLFEETFCPAGIPVLDPSPEIRLVKEENEELLVELYHLLAAGPPDVHGAQRAVANQRDGIL